MLRAIFNGKERRGKILLVRSDLLDFLASDAVAFGTFIINNLPTDHSLLLVPS